MDAEHRRLLIETHGAVMEIRGTLPHLATRGDLSTAIATHEAALHPRSSRSAPPRIANLRGKLLGALIALATAVATALTVYASSS